MLTSTGLQAWSDAARLGLVFSDLWTPYKHYELASGPGHFHGLDADCNVVPNKNTEISKDPLEHAKAFKATNLDRSARAKFPQQEHLLLLVKRHSEERVQVVVDHLLQDRQHGEVFAVEADRPPLRIEVERGVRVRADDSVMLVERCHVTQLSLRAADGELKLTLATFVHLEIGLDIVSD